MTSQPPAPYLFLVYWTWLWSSFFLETFVRVQDFRKVNVISSELDLSICETPAVPCEWAVRRWPQVARRFLYARLRRTHTYAPWRSK